MRKAAIVFLLAAVMVIGWSLVPSRQRKDVAIADVARAMAQVKTVHYIGWNDDPYRHKRVAIEGWADDKGRHRQERDHALDDAVIDSNKFVAVMGEGVLTTAEECPGRPKTGILTMFSSEYWENVEREPGLKVNSKAITLADGKPGVVLTVERKNGEKFVVKVDASTRRVVSLEDGADKPTGGITQVDYDVEISEAMFAVRVDLLPAGEPTKATDLDSRASSDLLIENIGRQPVQIVVDGFRRQFQVFGTVKLSPSGETVEYGIISYSGELIGHTKPDYDLNAH